MVVKNSVREEIEKLLKKKPLLLDGAMGTMLYRNGLKSGDCPEEWNISNSQVIENIHKEYIKAGSDIILTNTFGANGIKLSNYGKEKEVKIINESAVSICRNAIDNCNIFDKNIYIAGSIGPTGKLLEPYGDLSVEKAYEAYSEEAVILEKSGVDMIVLETFFDLEEIKAALKAVKKNTNLMVFASMTFDKNLKTIYGITPEKDVLTLENEGADGVGANCGIGPEIMYEILKLMKKVSTKYLLVEPNAGLPELVNGKIFYPASPEKMANYAKKYKELKVNIIGGCCGTTPLHIRTMSDKMKNVSL